MDVNYTRERILVKETPFGAGTVFGPLMESSLISDQGSPTFVDEVRMVHVTD